MNYNAKKISEIADYLNIDQKFLEFYGNYKAKISLDILETQPKSPKANYVLVSAVTPTPLGEGKTTTTIGLGMALNKLGKKSIVALRQSSLGPTFGIKGGGAGGGLAQIIPLEDSILHLTGDFHAIAQAHNQIAAMLDNVLYHGNELNIDQNNIQFRRVIDVNDRFLRSITIGQGGDANGVPRSTGFDITTASELMAILALIDGTSNKTALQNLRQRISKMVLAFDTNGKPITAEDIKAAGAATALMRDAIKPTLMQTAENTPVLIHTGPFANIAHGCSSILADRIGLNIADFVITEGGFGADMGAEKFFDIKCRTSKLTPNAAVLVTTVRAMKAHSNKYKIVAGKPLPPELLLENPEDVLAGCGNLAKQINNLRTFGIPVVVAINSFPEDKDSEINIIKKFALENGAFDVALSNVYTQGGAGGLELATKVMEACKQKSEFTLLYPDNMPLKQKINTLATKIYGAKKVSYSELAETQLNKFESLGYGNLPICMAKTHLSISHDSKSKGAPSDYIFPIREVRASVGAGFIYPLADKIMTMPGLAKVNNAQSIDIDDLGNISNLF